MCSVLTFILKPKLSTICKSDEMIVLFPCLCFDLSQRKLIHTGRGFGSIIRTCCKTGK